MPLDLVDRFKELSVSSSKLIALNKKPLVPRYDPEEFYPFDTFKHSSRILMNYKDMSTMGLKAGSYVKLFAEGTKHLFFDY